MSNHNRMFVDILLDSYAAGDTFNAALGSPVDADNVASEIVGSFRTYTTKDGNTHAFLKADGGEGISQDGPFKARLLDTLKGFEQGVLTNPSLSVDNIIGWLYSELRIAKKINEVKSLTRADVMFYQDSELKNPNGKLRRLLTAAFKAAHERQGT